MNYNDNCLDLNYPIEGSSNDVEDIRENETMKAILKDSFGGVMYDVANRTKYDTEELLALWEALSPSERESADGIISGAINFIKS